MNVAAAIPVNGRHPLLRHTIERLLNKCGVSHVICVGNNEDKKLCESSGAEFIQFNNNPLGAKWNRAFIECKKYNPDAVLFVGSSDWVSDNWVSTLFPYLETYDMVGKSGCHLLDIQRTSSFRLVYWPGYKSGSDRRSSVERAKEPIGIGRLISKKGLDSIGWQPFDRHQESSLDWTMYQKLKNNAIVEDNTIHSLALSCDRWSNKHKFDEHWTGLLKSQKMPLKPFLNQFPEAYKIFQ